MSLAVAFVIDSNLAAPGGKGSAQILSTSKKIACTAFVSDQTSSPPTSGWATIIAKMKQKAAN